jgi:hypothetical protein
MKLINYIKSIFRNDKWFTELPLCVQQEILELY